MLKDSILAATIAGMIATLFKTVPNVILWRMGVVEHLYLFIASSALIRPEDATTVWGLILGVVVDIITGGTLGLLIMLFFNVTGRDYWWYKGLIVGNIIWLFGLGVAINLGASRIVPVDPIFRLTSLIEHQIFGLVGAYLIVKWYPESEEHKEKVKIAIDRQLTPIPVRKPVYKERKD